MQIANSHEKVLSIVNNQVNANQTTVRYHLILLRMATVRITKTKTTSIGKDVGKLVPNVVRFTEKTRRVTAKG